MIFNVLLVWKRDEQIVEKEGRLPDAIVACIGGGSNAIGMFHPFIEDEEVALYGVEAAGSGIETGLHAAAIADGKEGVLHGAYMYVLQDDDGFIQEAHSISAGLDYPAVGPEHSYLHDIGRVTYTSVTDAGHWKDYSFFAKIEGIIPALESAHAIYYAVELAGRNGSRKKFLSFAYLDVAIKMFKQYAMR